MSKTFVNSDNTIHRPSSDPYSKTISQITKDGVCPFCPDHLATYHPNPIIKEGKYWLYSKNAYPYKGARHHFIVIHKAHIEGFAEITQEAWAELRELINDMSHEHNIKGGALVCRFGETKYNGASVSHLHAQVIVGPGTPDADPVLMRVG